METRRSAQSASTDLWTTDAPESPRPPEQVTTSCSLARSVPPGRPEFVGSEPTAPLARRYPAQRAPGLRPGARLPLGSGRVVISTGRSPLAGTDARDECPHDRHDLQEGDEPPALARHQGRVDEEDDRRAPPEGGAVDGSGVQAPGRGRRSITALGVCHLPGHSSLHRPYCHSTRPPHVAPKAS